MGVALKYYSNTANAGDLFAINVAERYVGPVSARAGPGRFGALNVMLVGSLIHWCDRDTIVCGSGMISKRDKPPEMPRKIIAVRGPRTRTELQKLGGVVPKRYGDPGLLAADFAIEAIQETHDYGVILHDVDRRWQRNFGRGWLRRRDDTLYIDIRQDPLTVISAIQQCETIFSSSLHGLIFAHALSKKALWVRCSSRIVGGTFKFIDYFESIGFDENSVNVEQIMGTQNLRSLADRAQIFDVSMLLPQVRENLAETRAYMEAAESSQR